MKAGVKNTAGMTMPELLLAAALLSIVLVGLLLSYAMCLGLDQLSRNSTRALYAAQARLEEIKSTPYDHIKGMYHTTTFSPPSLDGMGVSYVDDSDPRLLLVTVTVCWRQPNGRVIGEDKNLNGILDAGEDTNMNNMIDSLVTLTTHLYNQ